MIKLLAILACASAAIFSVAGAEPDLPRHHVIYIDTSSTLTKNKETVSLIVSNILVTGFNGAIRRGETVTIRAFDDSMRGRRLDMQVWTPETGVEIAGKAIDLVNARRSGRTSRIERITAEMASEAKAYPAADFVLLLDGESLVKGTPFDDQLTGLLVDYRTEARQNRQVFVAALLARERKLVTWSMDLCGSPSGLNPQLTALRRPDPQPSAVISETKGVPDPVEAPSPMSEVTTKQNPPQPAPDALPTPPKVSETPTVAEQKVSAAIPEPVVVQAPPENKVVQASSPQAVKALTESKPISEQREPSTAVSEEKVLASAKPPEGVTPPVTAPVQSSEKPLPPLAELPSTPSPSPVPRPDVVAASEPPHSAIADSPSKAAITNNTTPAVLAVPDNPPQSRRLLVAGILLLGAAGGLLVVWLRLRRPPPQPSLISQSISQGKDKRR